MGLTLVSLNAVSVTGIGAALEFDVPRSPVSLHVIVTGAPTFEVDLEGSIDGINWARVGATTSAGAMVSATAPVMMIRANLTSISGGTSPTITALLAAAG